MKTILFCILYIFAVVLLLRCAKEYSCEGGCGGEVDTFKYPPSRHPIKIKPPIRDTTITYNELISYYDFWIIDNSAIRKIYFCVMTKYHPGHYYITDSIPVQSSPSSYYNGFLNLKHYLDMNDYVKNDTFPVFYQVRYKNGVILETDSATLIY